MKQTTRRPVLRRLPSCMEYDVWDYSHGANEFMDGISKFCTLLHRLGQSKGPCFHFNAQASTFKWGMRVPLRMTEHAILCSLTLDYRKQ